ncbi:MAG: c-type cytochrome [Planctomycetota bacterium]|nr:MAG: c-type cytochrome [Planctomycetota bacterium]
MAERGDTHYKLSRMNAVFLLTSALLLGIAVWMVIDDWNRPWKQFQREYREMEYQRAAEQIAALETPEWQQQKQELERRITELQERLDSDAEHERAHAAARAAEGRRYKAESEFKIASANANWARFQVNQAWAGGDRSGGGGYAEAAHKLEEARREKEASERELAEASARLAAVTGERDRLQAELLGLTREADQLVVRMRSFAPSVFNSLRDFPGLDFVVPTVNVRKQVLPQLRKDYNFTTVARVDMCSSCHVAVDNPAYAGSEPPLNAHPRLDLFLSSGSPHPIDAIGCTVCHEGAAETLDFSRAVHTPEDEHEREEWQEKWGWHHWHLWDWPMLPTKYTEAGCYGCHSTGSDGPTLETIAPDAPRLSRGLALVERYGCYSCHNLQGWRDNRKIGPALDQLREKLSPEFTRAWIADPHDFRPSTRMPQVFHLENRVSAEWDDTAIAAVQAYLWGRSMGRALAPIPAEAAEQADPARGEALFRQVGCVACHNSPVTQPHEYSDFGPDLAGVGSKLSEQWLYHWLLDPESWWPDTRMPNLRLEPQQAADIARFLSGWKKDGWEPAPVAPDAAQLERQALAFLNSRYTLDEARTVYARWREEGGEQRVLEEVGQRWIARQGCYSCHSIPGFESGMPIGTDLSDWGNKNLHQLAFELWSEKVPGHLDGAVEPSRHAFAELKLGNPRRFDRGLEVAPLDRLRMPDFKLSEEEIEAITTVLLGLKDNAKVIQPGAYPRRDPTEIAYERGAFLARRLNCLGCHKFEMDTLLATEEADGRTLVHRYHGQVTLEDEDEEATYFKLWKTDADLAAAEDGAGTVGSVAEIPWVEDANGELKPWPVLKGAGGGVLDGLIQYYVDTGAVGDALEAFPLVPPILYGEGEKVRAPWVTQFLLAPYTLRPWLTIRMPRFRLSEQDARDLSLYFVALSRKEWPSKYARALRSSLGQSATDLAQAIGATPEQLREIEAGGRYNENVFGKLLAYGAAQGFQYDAPPDLPFEEVAERSPVYLAAREAATPGYLDKGGELIGPGGVDCYACHIKDGKEPGGDKLSWGPDLGYAKERLRPDWVRRWVVDAQKIYPGTKMPTALDLLANPRLDEILPGTALERVEAVKDFLMNSEKVREPATSTAMTGN